MQEQARRTIHYTELQPLSDNSQLAAEWNFYVREIARWLAEGLEGRYVVIKGEEVIGLYDTWAEARSVGLKRYLREPFFVKQILAEEPVLRIRGVNFPWPSCSSPSRPPA